MSAASRSQLCNELVTSFMTDIVPRITEAPDAEFTDIFIVLENMTAGVILLGEKLGAPRKVMLDTYIESLTRRLQEL